MLPLQGKLQFKQFATVPIPGFATNELHSAEAFVGTQMDCEAWGLVTLLQTPCSLMVRVPPEGTV